MMSPGMGPKRISGHKVFVLEKKTRRSMQGQSSLQHCTSSTYLQLLLPEIRFPRIHFPRPKGRNRGGSGKVVSSITHSIVQHDFRSGI